MSIDPISSILSIGEAAIKRIWPDPAQQAEEQRKLIELAQNGDLARLDAEVKLMIAQLEVNKIEAGSKSVFVAGARPFIIWAGGFSLVWAGIIHPMLLWIWAFAAMKGQPPPMVEPGLLGTIVTGLLGVGTMRSYDKKQGTQTDKIF